MTCSSRAASSMKLSHAGALLPHLGTQAHGCLADAVEAFPNRPFVSPTHLHRFHQVLAACVAHEQVVDHRDCWMHSLLRTCRQWKGCWRSATTSAGGCLTACGRRRGS